MARVQGGGWHQGARQSAAPQPIAVLAEPVVHHVYLRPLGSAAGCPGWRGWLPRVSLAAQGAAALPTRFFHFRILTPQVVTNVTAAELARRLEKEGVVVLSFFAGWQPARAG